MEKVLISMPEQLVARMRAVIPARQRSKIFVCLMVQEIEKREQLLYECAIAVEKDTALQQEMKEWDTTLADGLDDESW